MRATSLHWFLNTEHQVDFNSKHVKEVYTCKFGGFYMVEDVIKCLYLFLKFADLSSHKLRMFFELQPAVSSCSTWSMSFATEEKESKRNRISGSNFVLYTCVWHSMPPGSAIRKLCVQSHPSIPICIMSFKAWISHVTLLLTWRSVS